jgi:uncharacterized protein
MPLRGVMDFKISFNMKKIEHFCQRNHITSMALFGSVLTRAFTPDSDVDFLVKFEKAHIPTLFSLVDMESELSQIVGRKADLRTVEDISHFFRDDVLKAAEVIYEAS